MQTTCTTEVYDTHHIERTVIQSLGIPSLVPSNGTTERIIDANKCIRFTDIFTARCWQCIRHFWRLWQEGWSLYGLIAITDKDAALMLVIDKHGNPVGVTSYGIHAIEERAPIAFVPGFDSLSFNMEPLP